MHRTKRCCLLVAAGLVLGTGYAQPGDSSYLGNLPTGDRWIKHLTGDLLPFWSMPTALGNPLGSFPSVRCDDGSLLDYSNPCPAVAGNSYLLVPAQYLVSVSRQTYGYGVAYHLTGDPKYLGYMKTGIEYIRRYAVDPSGGMYTVRDLVSNTWGPPRALRDPQQLGYGLLGLAMYYYLTRDELVLPDIFAIKDYIVLSYYNRALGTMQWTLENDGSKLKQLVADLDQMNTYMVLLAPILPEPQRTEWRQTLALLSRSILGTFYAPGVNLFFTSANTPRDRDLAFSGVDFGHSSKSLWMLRWTGFMLGDRGLVSFSEAAGRRLFDRAYLPEDGSWAEGVLPGGQTDKNKNWWIFAELDQYSGTLAVDDLNSGRYLPQTANYWFKYFVDPVYGEVWNGVNYGANTPQHDYPKAWFWKSAYHSFEHALVGYITAQYLHGEPVTLHYAFQKPVDQALIHPYYFPGTYQSVEVTKDSGGSSYQTITFSGPTPTPVPALTTVSGASFLAEPVAPGSIAAVFGNGLSTVIETPPPGQVLIPSPGTTVAIQDSTGTKWTASLYSASPGQVNFLVPASAAPGNATITITPQGGAGISAPLRIATVSPGIFQLDLSTALAAANVVRVKPDLSQSIEAVYQAVPGGGVRALPIDLGPATEQVYLTLWGTGIFGAKSVAVTVGGQEVGVLYWGPQRLSAGVNPAGVEQVNIGPLPRSLAGSGSVNIILSADGQTANPVQVAIQ